MKKFFLLTAVMLLGLGLIAQDGKQKKGAPPKKELKGAMVVTSADATVSGRLVQQKSETHKDVCIPDLTEEQRNAIKQLRLEMTKEVRKNTNLLREKKARLTTLQDEDKPNQQAINKTIDEITALKGQIMKAQANFRTKVNALLNDEQRLAFQRSEMRGSKGFRSSFGTCKSPDIRIGRVGQNVRVLNKDGEEISDWKSIKAESIKRIRVIKKDGEAEIHIEEN